MITPKTRPSRFVIELINDFNIPLTTQPQEEKQQ